ncbi:MAG: serine protease [Verrucomicrobiaceae bacterium]|nr:MAG: serine protease [Verrucomicrobiaceae bacterium]
MTAIASPRGLTETASSTARRAGRGPEFTMNLNEPFQVSFGSQWSSSVVCMRDFPVTRESIKGQISPDGAIHLGWQDNRAKYVSPPHWHPSESRIEMKSALWLFSSLALTGCGIGGLRDRREDNGKVRALQEASVSRYGERPIAGQSIDGFFKDKVGLIAVEGGSLPVGRAVPISSDGYYLTALHVVAESDFRLSNSSYSGGRMQVSMHPGRVVWNDRLADLAIVKFEFRPASIFKTQGFSLRKGDAVFTGANGRNSGALVIPPRPDGSYHLGDVIRKGTGNGRFRTAGAVTYLSNLNGEPSRMIYKSTLVGRGGMSGGPVVNRKGCLVGIVTSAQATMFSAPQTIFSMIDPEALNAIVQADRNRR